MANIQPFDYQKSTNIEEHNQIVNKVNEIVEVINNVNLDTINSEIANLKTKATETDTEIANIKNKDTTQDTEINGITKNLVSNVTATFDNPSRELKISLGRETSPSIDATVVIPASSETGQYSEGNGIKIQNYQISVDTNVVAFKTDIPDVNGLTQRVNTLETEMPTKASVDDVNSKVAIAQGIENAGKVLGVGSDGNVTPVNAGGSSGGGEVWEEINLSNWPTDWVAGDKIRVNPYRYSITANADTWKNAPSITNSSPANTQLIFEAIVNDSGGQLKSVVHHTVSTNFVEETIISLSASASTLNNFKEGTNIGNSQCVVYNGGGNIIQTNLLTFTEISTYINKMWRCRASTQSP